VKTTSIARWAGLTVGFGLALAALAGARVSPGTHEVPAHVSLVAESSVQLGVTPVGRELLSERLLLPGRQPVSGRVELSNYTGGKLVVRPRLRSLRGELPAGLRIQITAGGTKLYTGSPSDPRAALSFHARAKQSVRFRISAPKSAAREVQGRVIELSIRWATGKAGS
jgi:hypothetical protein